MISDKNITIEVVSVAKMERDEVLYEQNTKLKFHQKGLTLPFCSKFRKSCNMLDSFNFYLLL